MTETTKMTGLYSIGYGGLVQRTFLKLMQEYHIEILIDCRVSPFCKHAPEFNGNAISGWLSTVATEYQYNGKKLGGFYQTIEEIDISLLAMLSEDRRICVMCCERDPRECHRSQEIGRMALAIHNIDTHHIVPYVEKVKTEQYFERVLRSKIELESQLVIERNAIAMQTTMFQ